MRFGRLTVIERAEDYVSPSGHKNVQWLCECSCETNRHIIVSGCSLTRGLTKSCGCLKKDISTENGKKNKKYNTYDLSGEYGIGYTSKGEEFYFDLEDYDLIKDYCWHIDNKGYVVSHNPSGSTLFHRQLLDCKCIDHINHNTRDNRKSNLRNVTYSQNQMNTSKRHDNTSGITGVDWHKHERMCRARIQVNGKSIMLGYFNSFEDAVKARKEAEEKYFGEYSYNNSIKKIN